MCIITPFLNNGRKEEMNSQEFYMTACVQEIGEKIEVEVITGEYAYGVYLIITGDSTKYHGITRESLKVGDKIKIVYNGQVMMSYPPQVAALEIYLI